MTKSQTLRHTALVDQLSDDTQAKLLVGLGFDFLMGQPVNRFVSPERVLAHVREALRPSHVERVLLEHVRPFFDRDLERAGVRNDRLEDYLTPEALTLFRHLAEQPVTLDRRFLEGFVEQEAVRHLLRVVVEETISRFVQMLKPGGSKGPFSKGLFAKLGAQMESQLQRAATAFVSTSLDFLLKRLAQVLATPETEQQLGRLRREGFNLARDEIQEAILAEAEAALLKEGKRLVGELVEPEAVARWRNQSLEIGGPLLAEFACTAELKAWLQES